jgi:hypothetical protein
MKHPLLLLRQSRFVHALERCADSVVPTAVERLAKKEGVIDPNYSTQRSAALLASSRSRSAMSPHLLVKRALTGGEQKLDKVKTADISAYLIQNAQP